VTHSEHDVPAPDLIVLREERTGEGSRSARQARAGKATEKQDDKSVHAWPCLGHLGAWIRSDAEDDCGQARTPRRAHKLVEQGIDALKGKLK
jgi:hypothetical protein